MAITSLTSLFFLFSSEEVVVLTSSCKNIPRINNHHHPSHPQPQGSGPQGRYRMLCGSSLP